MRIILLGAPGSGKGSVGGLLGSTYGFPLISTGNLLREAVRKRTPLGLQAEAQMGRGDLVDDALVLKLLAERLAEPDCRGGYVLDGYPRNVSQARDLEGLDGRRRELVFLIDTDEDIVVRRLETRRICPHCGAIYNVVTKRPSREGVCDVCGSALVQRADDRADVIRERMKTYHEKTEPLVAYYRAKDAVRRIDGNGTVEEAFRPVRAALDAAAAEAKARP